MKRIKLEVIVMNKNAGDTLTSFQKIIVNNIYEYSLSMEDCGNED